MTQAFVHFFLFNMGMDFLCLMHAARWMQLKISLPSFAGAACMGGIYSILTAGMGENILSLLLSCLLMSGCAFGRKALKGALGIFLTGLLLSGTAGLLERIFHSPFAACMGSMGAGGILLLHIPRAKQQSCTLQVVWRHRKTRLPAVLDTGNLLRDTLTGLPVIVAPFSMLKDILPPDEGVLPQGMRLIRADTAGGTALLPCFHPQRVELWKVKKQRVDMLVAVTPQHLPGALIPGEMLGKTR